MKGLTGQLGLMAFLAAALLGGGSTVAYAAGGCPGATTPTNELSKEDVRSVMQCLVNRERDSNVKQHNQVEEAAQKHSQVMRNKECLSHQCPGEPDIVQRVKRTGYSNTPRVGEVIAGFDKAFTPQMVMAAWMNSSEHRAIIRNPSHDHVGVGVSIGEGTAYYTVVLASK